ncbi:diguanylate cyclase regulator RdcB family protein [Streptomyces sp. NPDC058739]|uniref:diguanylate cyclase regulator RdcB family protein n=1 Tax=Streptomyces sp. NPDC058739 TaxID=3346618 RepID=UPI0036C2A34D
MKRRALNPSDVAGGVPLVGDRLLLELLNDLHTADDLVRASVREGFFARLLGQVTGHRRRRDLIVKGSLAGAQRDTLSWVSSLTGRLAVTDLAVAEVADEVGRVGGRTEELDARLTGTEQGVRELAFVVAELAEHAGNTFGQHDERLRKIESSLAIDNAVRRWRHPHPDARLGWLCAAVLLAREVATGPAGELAVSKGGGHIERELVERMFQDPPTPWYEGVRSVVGMLAEATRELPSDDHRLMVAELLGEGLPDGTTRGRGPLTAALSGTALAAATPDADHTAVARTALGRAVGSGSSYVAGSLTAEELLRQIVREQFAEAATRRSRLQAAEGNP